MKLFFSLLLFFVFFISAFSENENIGVLALANGAPITLADVLEISSSREAQLAMVYKGEELEKEIFKLRKEVLETVIDRKLIYHDFVAHDFKLPRDFLENNLDVMLRTFKVSTRHELEMMLKENGKTMNEFKDKVYENIAVEALIYGRCFKDAFVTPKDVYDYYEANKDNFTSQASIKLRVITLNKKGAHEQDAFPLSIHLEKKLKGKKESDFVDAVSLYSDGPNLNEGGELNWINVKDLRKEFADIITEYKEGIVYGPVNTDDAIYFFYIKQYSQSNTQSYESVKAEIKNKLLDDVKQKAYKEYVESLRKNAFVQYFI